MSAVSLYCSLESDTAVVQYLMYKCLKNSIVCPSCLCIYHKVINICYPQFFNYLHDMPDSDSLSCWFY